MCICMDLIVWNKSYVCMYMYNILFVPDVRIKILHTEKCEACKLHACHPIAETVFGTDGHPILHLLANSMVIGKAIAGNSRARAVWHHAPDVMGGHMSRGVTCIGQVRLSAAGRHATTWQGDADDAEYSRLDERQECSPSRRSLQGAVLPPCLHLHPNHPNHTSEIDSRNLIINK